MQMKNLSALEETEAKKALYDFFSSSTGRRLGRLVTAERSKGSAGDVTARITDLGTIFRACLRDLYLQPEPKVMGEP